MSDDLLTLDACGLAEGIREKRFSPVEVLTGCLARVDALNPRLNAIVTMIDGAMERAQQAEAATMRGESWGPSPRRPLHRQGLRRYGGHQDHRRLAHIRRQRARQGRDGRHAPARRGRGDDGEDQPARVRPLVGDGQPHLRHDEKPVGREPHHRRLQRRRGGCRRQRHVAPGHRQRRGRVDPPAREPLRPRWAEGHPRTNPAHGPLARRTAALHARRPPDQDRARLGPGAPHPGRERTARTRMRSVCRRPTST